jgi:hypothetical protein
MIRRLRKFSATTALVVVFGAAPVYGEDRCQDAKLTEVRSLAELPDGLRRLLPSATTGLDGIADRGGRFNPTDVVSQEVPMRRFTLAAVGSTCAVVAVERGGRGHYFELTEYRLNDATWKSVDRETRSEGPKSLAELVGRR